MRKWKTYLSAILVIAVMLSCNGCARLGTAYFSNMAWSLLECLQLDGLFRSDLSDELPLLDVYSDSDGDNISLSSSADQAQAPVTSEKEEPTQAEESAQSDDPGRGMLPSESEPSDTSWGKGDIVTDDGEILLPLAP